MKYTNDPALKDNYQWIDSLNEMDTVDLLKSVAGHIQKNKMEHIIDQVFDTPDDLTEEVSDLNDEIFNQQVQIDRLDTDISVLTKKLQDIKNIIG